MPDVSAARLIDFAAALLAGAGVAPGEARIVAESLVESNLRGYESHGVVRVLEYVEGVRQGSLVTGAPFEVLTDLPALLVADARHGFGQVQCAELVARVCAKARTAGIATGLLRNAGHVGRLGEWVERAAAQNLAALLSVNDNGVEISVAPPGGTAARISTNPLAIAVPTGGDPLVLDISTSAVANGKVKVARLAGQPCPEGWVQDAAGRPSTDPHVMLADPPGALVPLGGAQAYKGFGLGLLLDMLVSGLSGGFCPPAPSGAKLANNVLLAVWDPAQCAGLGHFTAEADKLIDWVRNTPATTGSPGVQLPGDRSSAVLKTRRAHGIPVADGVWQALAALATELGVAVP